MTRDGLTSHAAPSQGDSLVDTVYHPVIHWFPLSAEVRSALTRSAKADIAVPPTVAMGTPESPDGVGELTIAEGVTSLYLRIDNGINDTTSYLASIAPGGLP